MNKAKKVLIGILVMDLCIWFGAAQSYISQSLTLATMANMGYEGEQNPIYMNMKKTGNKIRAFIEKFDKH